METVWCREGGRTHDLAIIDRALCQLSYPWIQNPNWCRVQESNPRSLLVRQAVFR